MPLSVLIVEDELILAMDIEDFLSLAGHRVVGHAVSAPQAVRMCEQHSEDIDVAIMDVHLAHGTSGLNAARTIWENWEIPSLFVSGNIDKTLRMASADINPVGYVGKPYSEREILAALQAMG